MHGHHCNELAREVMFNSRVKIRLLVEMLAMNILLLVTSVKTMGC